MNKYINCTIIVIALCLAANPAKAQYLTLDTQSLAALKLLKSVGDGQLQTMGDVLKASQEGLGIYKSINSTLGTPGGLNAILQNSNLMDLQTLVSHIPGMEKVNMNDLFPAGVGSAFLGKTFNQWEQMITNPTSLMAEEIGRSVMGSAMDGKKGGAETMNFINYAMSSGGSADKVDLAASFARMLTATVFDNSKTQAQQQVVLAQQKKKLDDAAQKPDLTILDRTKLIGDQNSLRTEMELQALQAQNLSNLHQGAQLDAQTQLMEAQMTRDELNRATVGSK